jgi:hypothetical protein
MLFCWGTPSPPPERSGGNPACARKRDSRRFYRWGADDSHPSARGSNAALAAAFRAVRAVDSAFETASTLVFGLDRCRHKWGQKYFDYRFRKSDHIRLLKEYMSKKIDAFSYPDRTFELLRIVACFGHADAHIVGAIAFRGTSAGSLLTTVRRELTRSVTAKLVDTDLNAVGSTSYFLTHAGARFLSERGNDFVAQAGEPKNMKGSSFYHRIIGSTYLAAHLQHSDVAACVTEFQLMNQSTGFDVESIKLNKGQDFSEAGINKLPDGLIFYRNCNEHAYERPIDWLEAENGKKDDAEYHRAFRAVWQLNKREVFCSFKKPFENLRGQINGTLRLIFAVPEYSLQTVHNITRAVQTYDTLLKGADAEFERNDFSWWQQIRDNIHIAIIPFKRNNWHADGKVTEVALHDAHSKMRVLLAIRARASMSKAELRAVFDLELDTVFKALVLPAKERLLPDFGFMQRQKRKANHRALGDEQIRTRFLNIESWLQDHGLEIVSGNIQPKI